MKFTSHDMGVQKVLSEMKAIQNPTEQQKKIIELAEKDVESKDILTSHKMEYLKAGYDPETGKKLVQPEPINIEVPSIEVPAEVPESPALESVSTVVEKVKKPRGNPNFKRKTVE